MILNMGKVTNMLRAASMRAVRSLRAGEVVAAAVADGVLVGIRTRSGPTLPTAGSSAPLRRSGEMPRRAAAGLRQPAGRRNFGARLSFERPAFASGPGARLLKNCADIQ